MGDPCYYGSDGAPHLHDYYLANSARVLNAIGEYYVLCTAKYRLGNASQDEQDDMGRVPRINAHNHIDPLHQCHVGD